MGLSAAALFAAETTKPAAPAKEAAAKVATKETKETAKKAEAKPAEKKAEEKKPAEKKPGEMSEADKELMAHASKESAKLDAGQKKKLLDLVNTGDDKALEAVPGIGEAKAAHIKKARPLKSVDDLIMVEGIGEKTFDDIVKWTAGGMTEEAAEPKKEAPKKPEAKKEPAKKEAAKAPEAPKPAPAAPAKKP